MSIVGPDPAQYRYALRIVAVTGIPDSAAVELAPTAHAFELFDAVRNDPPVTATSMKPWMRLNGVSGMSLVLWFTTVVVVLATLFAATGSASAALA